MQATPATWRLLLGAGWQGRPRSRCSAAAKRCRRDLPSAARARAASCGTSTAPPRPRCGRSRACVGAGTARHADRPADRQHPASTSSTQRMPVPIGVAGELYIGGDGVARGYLNRPGADRRAVRPDPFAPSGQRLYRTGDLGRWRADGSARVPRPQDHQVKVRGFRIELGEIEAGPAVAPRRRARRWSSPARTAAGDVRLVAYLVARRRQLAEDAPARAPAPGILPDTWCRALRRARRCRSPPTARSTAGRCRRRAPAAAGAAERRRGSATSSRTIAPASAPSSSAFRARHRRRLLRARRPLAAGRAARRAPGRELGRACRCAGLRAPDGRRPGRGSIGRAGTEGGAAARSRAAPTAARRPLSPDAAPPLVPRAARSRPHGLPRALGAPPARPSRRGRLRARVRRVVRRQDVAAHRARHRRRRPSSGLPDRPAPLAPVEDLRRSPGGPRRGAGAAPRGRDRAAVRSRARPAVPRAPVPPRPRTSTCSSSWPHHVIWDGWSFDLLLPGDGGALRRLPARASPLAGTLPVTYGDFAAWHRDWMAGPELAAPARLLARAPCRRARRPRSADRPPAAADPARRRATRGCRCRRRPRRVRELGLRERHPVHDAARGLARCCTGRPASGRSWSASRCAAATCPSSSP